MNTIKVDKKKCNGCKTCYKACWLDVIRWDEKNNLPCAPYAYDCVECDFCEAHCPTGAFKVIVDFSRPFPKLY